MADSKFSALPAITTIDRANDVIPVMDMSEADASKPKNITPKDLTKGKQTIAWPAGSMDPTETAGCAPAVRVETTTNLVNYKVIDFNDTIEERAFFVIPSMPKSYDLGSLTFKVMWTQATAVSTAVVWALKLLARGDNEAIDTAYGTEVEVTDNAQGAAEEQNTSVESAAVTPGGTPAAEDALYGILSRKAADGGDTLVGDARAIGIKLIYNTLDGVDD